MMNLNRFLLGMALTAFALPGCSNEEQLSLDGTADAGTPLAISVTNAGLTKVGGVVTGSQFGDGASLGLFLTKEDGSSAYDTPYNNVKYTSSTSGSNQVWTTTPDPILLTGTKAKVYAYYPYNSTYNDITSIPIDVTQNQDVMWATPYSGAYNASPTATLPMNHALSVIRFSLSKGDYSGTGNITSIKIKGAGMAPTGTLNAKTGAVTPTDGGAEIDLGAAATLSSTPTNVEQLVIPTGSSGSIQVIIQMDGKTFKATSTASFTLTNSKAYKFGLVFTDSQLGMSEVSIEAITEVTGEDMTPTIGSRYEDGVYAIKSDGTLVAYADASDASYDGVAIVMYGRALQISNSELTSQKWGDTSIDISGIDNLTEVGGGVSGNTGFLPKSDGSYAGGTQDELKIIQDHTQWPSLGGVLADTAGWVHTKVLIDTQTDASYIGPATKAYRNGTLSGVDNQGYNDWFIPAIGQLAYICMYVTEINDLLDKCGGNQMKTDTSDESYHWSSCETDASRVWIVRFRDRYVNSGSAGHFKSRSYALRFFRYLN